MHFSSQWVLVVKVYCKGDLFKYFNHWVFLMPREAFEALEPCDGKLSWTGSEGTEWQQCQSVTRLFEGESVSLHMVLNVLAMGRQEFFLGVEKIQL